MTIHTPLSNLMKRRVHHLLCLASGLGLLGSAPSFVSAQSNIVFNGSFEQVGDGWVWSELGVYYNQVAADGLVTGRIKTGQVRAESIRPLNLRKLRSPC